VRGSFPALRARPLQGTAVGDLGAVGGARATVPNPSHPVGARRASPSRAARRGNPPPRCPHAVEHPSPPPLSRHPALPRDRGRGGEGATRPGRCAAHRTCVDIMHPRRAAGRAHLAPCSPPPLPGGSRSRSASGVSRASTRQYQAAASVRERTPSLR